MQIKTRIQEVTLSLNRQGRLKKNLSIAAAVVTLAVIGTLMNSRQSVAQGAGGPTVTIDPSQLPLPVKGSATISGTVAATQSEAWHVGIVGTPTVTIGGPLPVPVTPTVTQPIQVEVIRGLGELTSGFNAVVYVVPAKKRLAVEYFSATMGLPSTETASYALAIAPDPSISTTFFAHHIGPGTSFPCADCATNHVQTTASQPVRMYVEAGQVLVLSVRFSAGTADSQSFGFFSVSGYLVDAL